MVLLGNLLENAVEACGRQRDGEKFIRLSMKQVGAAIVIVLDNSFSGELKKEGQALLSSKREGAGVGLSSIQEIAKNYHGFVKFEQRGHLFSASVFLNP